MRLDGGAHEDARPSIQLDVQGRSEIRKGIVDTGPIREASTLLEESGVFAPRPPGWNRSESPFHNGPVINHSTFVRARRD